MNPFLPQVTSQQPMAPTLMSQVPAQPIPMPMPTPQPTAVPTAVPPAVAAQHAPGWMQGLNTNPLTGLFQTLIQRNPNFMAQFANAPWMARLTGGAPGQPPIGAGGMDGHMMGHHGQFMTPGGGGGGPLPAPTGFAPAGIAHMPLNPGALG